MELQKEYLVIRIKNSSKDFAETWAKITDLKEKTVEQLEQQKYSNFYYYSVLEEISGIGNFISKIKAYETYLPKVELKRLPLKYGICLWIEDCAENDIIEYQYLALMLQNMKDMICFIYPDSDDRVYKVYRNVSNYFSFFAQRKGRRERIWITRIKGKQTGIEMIGTGLANNAYKIVPVIELEQDRESDFSDLKNWTRTFDEFYAQCRDGEEICKTEAYQEILYSRENLKQSLRRIEKAGDEKQKVGIS